MVAMAATTAGVSRGFSSKGAENGCVRTRDTSLRYHYPGLDESLEKVIVAATNVRGGGCKEDRQGM